MRPLDLTAQAGWGSGPGGPWECPFQGMLAISCPCSGRRPHLQHVAVTCVWLGLLWEGRPHPRSQCSWRFSGSLTSE